MRLPALLLLLGVGCGPDVRPLHEEPTPLHGGLLAGVRPTAPSAQPPRFESSEQVESVVSPGGHFRLHFTRSGPNAVALADQDANGLPDAVELAARKYDQVAAFYTGLGYRLPPDDSSLSDGNGGDARFDVYLVDFARRADGAFRLDGCLDEGMRCTGHMLQENDFTGYSYRSYEEAVATLASHEFFHAVQAAYNPQLGIVASEGAAVWATERFDPNLDDLEHFSSSYMARPDRSLVVDPEGPALAFSYGSSLFFQFLGERFGDRLLLSMWEESLLAPSARCSLVVRPNRHLGRGAVRPRLACCPGCWSCSSWLPPHCSGGLLSAGTGRRRRPCSSMRFLGIPPIMASAAFSKIVGK